MLVCVRGGYSIVVEIERVWWFEWRLSERRPMFAPTSAHHQITEFHGHSGLRSSNRFHGTVCDTDDTDSFAVNNPVYHPTRESPAGQSRQVWAAPSRENVILRGITSSRNFDPENRLS